MNQKYYTYKDETGSTHFVIHFFCFRNERTWRVRSPYLYICLCFCIKTEIESGDGRHPWRKIPFELQVAKNSTFIRVKDDSYNESNIPWYITYTLK